MLRDSSVRCDQTAEVGVCCGADRLCRVARGYFTAVSQQSMTLWSAAGRCPGGVVGQDRCAVNATALLIDGPQCAWCCLWDRCASWNT
ncbi:hypothetical protein MLPF_1240 [Mycobacterium lepromatosis]|nr:hypothetical protein MLPF_1240 [Mycobacterium lepromatosis]